MRPLPGKLLAIAIALLMSLLSAVSYAQQALPEYVIKAGYLYHFGSLTTWPESTLDHDFKLCYSGSYDVSTALGALSGKQINGRPVHVYQPVSVADARGCHMLYLDDTNVEQSLQVIQSIQDRPVLTVTDDERLFNRGAAIFMRPEGQQLVFEIDNDIAKNADLDISSRLLRLGR